jgi:predicted transcriptional regulator
MTEKAKKALKLLEEERVLEESMKWILKKFNDLDNRVQEIIDGKREESEIEQIVSEFNTITAKGFADVKQADKWMEKHAKLIEE